MITLLYSTLATPNHPFSDATLLMLDDSHYHLTIPTMEDWTSAEVQINDYPPVDVTIQDEFIEIDGQFFEPEVDLWVSISIAKGSTFGGSYRFPLEAVPLPHSMPRFANPSEEVIKRTHTFWWRNPHRPPYQFFWERYDLKLHFGHRTPS